MIKKIQTLYGEKEITPQNVFAIRNLLMEEMAQEEANQIVLKALKGELK